jgi:hypothetical protein
MLLEFLFCHSGILLLKYMPYKHLLFVGQSPNKEEISDDELDLTFSPLCIGENVFRSMSAKNGGTLKLDSFTTSLFF